VKPNPRGADHPVGAGFAGQEKKHMNTKIDKAEINPTPPLQKMAAEILFHDPADTVDPCIAALREHGFEVEIFGRVDDHGLPAVRVVAQIITNVVATDRFLSWVSDLVKPFVEILDWVDDDEPQQGSA
jgi:hypothetical protein